MRGFVYAGRGVWFCVRHERNFRIHMTVGAYVLAVAPYFSLSRGEWIALLAVIALVLAMEALNTAVEQAVNLASPGRRTRARVAKDVAAGAVLICAVFAAVVGVLLFARRSGWAAAFADWRVRLWKPAILAASVPLMLWFIVGKPRKGD